jgi:hypothetical protein
MTTVSAQGGLSFELLPNQAMTKIDQILSKI